MSNSLSSSGDDISSSDEGCDVKTPNKVLRVGLRILGFSDKQIDRPKKQQKSNDRFTAYFGLLPHVLAQVWEDLQEMVAFKDQIKPIHRKSEIFLQAIYFLKRYQTEEEREGTWNVLICLLRDTNWQYVELIQMLKEKKIEWLHDERDIWVCTVHGTHVKSVKPTHPTLPKDEKAF